MGDTMSNIKFQLTRSNVRKIICNIGENNYDLKKVLDDDGSVLWQALIDTYFSDVYWYTSKTTDRTGCYPWVQYFVSRTVKEQENNTVVPGTVVESRFYKNPSTGQKVYVNNDSVVSPDYEGWYYGCDLYYQGYDDGTVSYDSSYYELLSTQLVHNPDPNLRVLFNNTDAQMFIATLGPDTYPYSGSIAWQWGILTAPNDFMSGFTFDVSGNSYTSSVSYERIVKEVTQRPDITKRNMPLYIYCAASIPFPGSSDPSDPSYNPNSHVEFYGTEPFYLRSEWCSPFLDYSDWPYSDLIVIGVNTEPSGAALGAIEATASGYYNLYADGVLKQSNIRFSAAVGNETASITAGNAFIDKEDGILYISTGLTPDWGVRYSADIHITKNQSFDAYDVDSAVSKILRPYEYSWDADGVYLGSSITYAPSGTTIYSDQIYLVLKDSPNGSGLTSYRFSGSYTLYANGSNIKSGTFSNLPPNSSGNLIVSTGYTAQRGVSYTAVITVNKGYGFAPITNQSLSDKITLEYMTTNVGGTITYLANSSATSGYDAKIAFYKYATRSIKVVIQRMNYGKGETTYSAWREYHFMVNDGDQTKATMLIRNSDGSWTHSSAAWYSKSGYDWTVEIGMDTGCRYKVTTIEADPSLSLYLICYNATTRLAYNGSNQYAWNQSAAIGSVTSGTKYATNVGGYSCTITKSENAIWKDTMTRFDYVRSFNWGIYGNWTGGGNPKLVVGGDFGSAWTNPVTGGTYSKREVYGCIYDYPNGTMTTSKRVTGTIKLYKDGSLLLEKSFTSAPNASGNVPIPTGHTVVAGSTYYALITVNEANYMTGLSNYRTDNFVHEHTWGSPTYTSDSSSSHTIREVCTKCDAVRTTTGAHTWDGNYTYSASHGSSTHARTDHCTYCNQARTVNEAHTNSGTGYRFKYNGNKTHERANVCKHCNKRYNIVTKNCTRPSGSKKCKYCDNKTSWHS